MQSMDEWKEQFWLDFRYFQLRFKNFLITESTGHLHNIILVKACLEFFPALLII